MNSLRSRRICNRHRSLGNHRPGITIIEVLAVTGIIGLLAAVLVPAVQMAREASRRTTCQSNLRQIMIAHHQYLDTYGVFPGIEGTFHFRLGASFGFERSNLKAKTPVFACPSDPLSTGESHDVSFSSYFGNNGLRTQTPGDGFSGCACTDEEGSSLNRFLAPRDITDGLSTTAAVCERLALPQWIYNPNYWYQFPDIADRLVLLTETRHDTIEGMADECTHRALNPVYSNHAYTFYNHIMTPNGNSCTNGRPFDSFQLFPLTAKSLHPQGVNLALGDGAVRFVSESISRDVWWALGTRAGNEPMDAGDF